MRGENQRLILCDGDVEYTHLFVDYCQKQRDVPWEIICFTNISELFETSLEQISFVVVAESIYEDRVKSFAGEKLILLNESGREVWPDLINVNKYQAAENVLKFLLYRYMDSGEILAPQIKTKRRATLIGCFSPVHRSMQTSLALVLAQLFSKTNRTLYLNFEFFAGIGELLPNLQTGDLSDLLYFLNADTEKFKLRLQIVSKQIGELDYVPPIKSGQDLLTITEAEWNLFFDKLESLEMYDYIILDFSECMQGLFKLLGRCRSIVTMVSDDPRAKQKLLQYEQLLELYEHGDVLKHTKRFKTPKIRKIPDQMEKLTRGELADLARSVMQTLNEEGG